MKSICIVIEDELERASATQLAAKLGVELASALEAEKYTYQLRLTNQGLKLSAKHTLGTSSLFVDFVKGSLGYRRKKGGGYQQALARAVGIKNAKQSLTVLDATAGLGKDAFVLACLGCRLHLIERSPIIAALLQDGLERALKDPELFLILRDRMFLRVGDAQVILQAMSQGTPEAWSCVDKATESADYLLEKPDVVYLDPMFPEENKTSLTTIDLRIIRDIVGPDLDAERLFMLAMQVAQKRVVVKRPRHAPNISAENPSFTLLGKSNRYDVYIQNAIKMQNNKL